MLFRINATTQLLVRTFHILMMILNTHLVRNRLGVPIPTNTLPKSPHSKLDDDAVAHRGICVFCVCLCVSRGRSAGVFYRYVPKVQHHFRTKEDLRKPKQVKCDISSSAEARFAHPSTRSGLGRLGATNQPTSTTASQVRCDLCTNELVSSW